MYKIIYFKLHQKDPVELEIGIVPEDDSAEISEDYSRSSRAKDNVILKVPNSVKVMKFKAGDPWPFDIPKVAFYSWEIATQFGSVAAIKNSIMEE